MSEGHPPAWPSENERNSDVISEAETRDLHRTLAILELRVAARAEAAEFAALCGSEISAHWTPDEAFLIVYSKSQLIGLLDEMGVEDDRTKAMKGPDLLGFVVEAAAERK